MLLDWANKAEAFASCAKMADDDSLRVLADRIQARAVCRMGELLKEFDARGGHMKNEGALISQKQAADAAGISEHQRTQAVRVANVPAAGFDPAIEIGIHHHIAGAYLLRYAQESSWREDTRLLGWACWGFEGLAMETPTPPSDHTPLGGVVRFTVVWGQVDCGRYPHWKTGGPGRAVGQFDCGRLTHWKTDNFGHILPEWPNT